MISVDSDAAGWGWSRFDLIRVLAHELGHLLGQGHSDTGVMLDVLDPKAVGTDPDVPDPEVPDPEPQVTQPGGGGRPSTEQPAPGSVDVPPLVRPRPEVPPADPTEGPTEVPPVGSEGGSSTAPVPSGGGGDRTPQDPGAAAAVSPWVWLGSGTLGWMVLIVGVTLWRRRLSAVGPVTLLA
ncbi:MAG: hypothetical protein IPL43_02580 [Micropruina sp.]|nr:hypothetical protein [Micropruina sp.]